MGNEQFSDNDEHELFNHDSAEQKSNKSSPEFLPSPLLIDISSKTLRNANKPKDQSGSQLSSSLQTKQTDTTPDGYLSPISPMSPLHESINKITKRVISDQIAELAANFWYKNIDSLCMKDRLV